MKVNENASGPTPRFTALSEYWMNGSGLVWTLTAKSQSGPASIPVMMPRLAFGSYVIVKPLVSTACPPTLMEASGNGWVMIADCSGKPAATTASTNTQTRLLIKILR